MGGWMNCLGMWPMEETGTCMDFLRIRCEPSSPLFPPCGTDRAWNVPATEEDEPLSWPSSSQAPATRPRFRRKRGTGGPVRNSTFNIPRFLHPPVPRRSPIADFGPLPKSETADAHRPQQNTTCPQDAPYVARRFQPVPVRGRIPDRPWPEEALFMDGPGPDLARLRARCPGHGVPPGGGFTSSLVFRQSSICGFPASRIPNPASRQPSHPSSGWPTGPAACTALRHAHGSRSLSRTRSSGRYRALGTAMASHGPPPAGPTGPAAATDH